MHTKALIFIILLWSAGLLAACQPVNTPVSIPSTPTPATPPTLPAATAAGATSSSISPSATPTLIPTMMAGELAVVSVEMQESPYFEPMLFTSVQGRKFESRDFSMGDTRYTDLSFFDGSAVCIKNELDGAALMACQHYTGDGTQSWVDLTRDGREIYRIDTGGPDPTNHLQGLWVYDHHWALETVYIRTHPSGNEVSTDRVGEISVDGVLLNDREKYDEAFGFQTLRGKPYYFFRRGDGMGFVYDGSATPLDFDVIPHYGCCSEAVLNPQAWVNHVNFFGQRGAAWFFVTVGKLTP